MIAFRQTLGAALLIAVATVADCQEIRNYNVAYTSNTIVPDGIVTPGEWDGAAGGGGAWRVLRQPYATTDADGNRFHVLYDDENLYVLYETDYDFGFLAGGAGSPQIQFGDENLNLYIDPNRDGDLNRNPASGETLDPTAPGAEGVDGYQIAFNQYLGTRVSRSGDRQGVGFHTEAHADSPFGDQGNWNGGSDPADGPALDGSGIVVGQTYSNGKDVPARSGGFAYGIAEIVIPFADLNAESRIAGPAPLADYNGDGVSNAADYTLWRDTKGDSVGGANNGVLDGSDGNDNGFVEIADYELWRNDFGADGTTATGLNATDDGTRAGPIGGEVWGFNLSMITRDSASNFLPIWNWHGAQSFALWPHGTITFGERPVAAAGAAMVPEGSALAFALAATPWMLVGRRRTCSPECR